jgi:hypothetical protein
MGRRGLVGKSANPPIAMKRRTEEGRRHWTQAAGRTGEHRDIIITATAESTSRLTARAIAVVVGQPLRLTPKLRSVESELQGRLP